MAPSHFTPAKLVSAIFDANSRRSKTPTGNSQAHNNLSNNSQQKHKKHQRGDLYLPVKKSKKKKEDYSFEFYSVVDVDGTMKAQSQRTESKTAAENWSDTGTFGVNGSRFELPKGYTSLVLTLEKPVSVQMGLSLIASDDANLKGYFRVSNATLLLD